MVVGVKLKKIVAREVFSIYLSCVKLLSISGMKRRERVGVLKEKRETGFEVQV